MSIIQAAGIETYYEQVGSGPVLILLHGWANTWEAWLPIIPMLSDHYTLIMPDLPGCGKTKTPSAGWSTKDCAKWLQDFLKQILQSPVYSIIGHSYGGKILLEYCSGDYSQQPNKIVILDASGIPNILNAKQRALRLITSMTPKKIKEKLPAAFRKKVYSTFEADSDYLTDNEFQRKTLQIILSEDYTPRFASITQPTLLLWGKNDLATPLWQGESMHSLIPLNQLKVYDAGHFPHHDFPKEVSADILTFLQ